MIDFATISGFVKWYDPSKGIGFVVSDAVSGDILMHSSALMEFGQSSVARGAAIQVKVTETARGLAVKSIIAIETHAVEDDKHVSADSAKDLSALEFQAARVKWYSIERGYGFVNIWGDPRDYFLGSKVLNKAGMTSAECGEALSVAVGPGEEEDYIAAVQPWHQ